MDKLSFLKDLRNEVVQYWTPYMISNRYDNQNNCSRPGPGCLVQQLSTIRDRTKDTLMYSKIVMMINNRLPSPIGQWNDSHTKQDVLALIDRLIVYTIEEQKEKEAHVPALSPKQSTVMEDTGSIPVVSTI